jgi:hypothetical protein
MTCRATSRSKNSGSTFTSTPCFFTHAFAAARAPECAIDLDANLTSAELDAEFCALASNYPLVLLDLLRTGVALDAIADRDLVLVVPPVA